MIKKRHLSERLMQAVRQRLDLDETDTSKDDAIRAMKPSQLVRHYFAWHLGSTRWAADAISIVSQAYGLELEE